MPTRIHHRLSVKAYEAMVDRGILKEHDRVELIRGLLLEKPPIEDRHAACVDRLNHHFQRRINDDILLSIQNPILLEDSVPEPDVCLLRARDDFYASGKPTPADILLVIEVADTSLIFDRDDKTALYAGAGIQEYWIVNLIDNLLERHTRPDPARGLYTLREVLASGAETSLVSAPDLIIAAADILG